VFLFFFGLWLFLSTNWFQLDYVT